MKNICGIDEAGRGPIAGDMVFAGCILHKNIEGLDDSKKLTAKKRERFYEQIIQNSTYHIVKISPAQIDKDGISSCISFALKQIKQNIPSSRDIFDGNSSFGVSDIEHLIKADMLIKEVSAASILAKVEHDRDIIKLAKLYPLYELEKHKGYATKRHIELVKKYGYSDIHRKSYKLKALEANLLEFF